MKSLALLALACATLTVVACASIASGTDQTITVSSVPDGKIEISSTGGQLYYSGRSPAIVVLSRDQTYTVRVRATGYREASFTIIRRLNAWYFGNLLFGWIAGFIIDALSGAMWRLEPTVVSVTLEAVALHGEPALAAVCTVAGRAGRVVFPLEPDAPCRGGESEL